MPERKFEVDVREGTIVLRLDGGKYSTKLTTGQARELRSLLSSAASWSKEYLGQFDLPQQETDQDGDESEG